MAAGLADEIGGKTASQHVPFASSRGGRVGDGAGKDSERFDLAVHDQDVLEKPGAAEHSALSRNKRDDIVGKQEEEEFYDVEALFADAVSKGIVDESAPNPANSSKETAASSVAESSLSHM